MRDDPYLSPRKNSLELIELSSINKVSVVQVSVGNNPYWTSREEQFTTDGVMQYSFNLPFFPTIAKTGTSLFLRFLATSKHSFVLPLCDRNTATSPGRALPVVNAKSLMQLYVSNEGFSN